MADMNVAMLVNQTVTEAQAQSRAKMGRDYASFYEAWAVLRQRIEETKRDAKALEKLHSELWDAIKDGNEDEVLVEMGAINASAAALCAAFAGMAAEAQRAVEEQTCRGGTDVNEKKPSPFRGWAKASADFDIAARPGGRPALMRGVRTQAGWGGDMSVWLLYI